MSNMSNPHGHNRNVSGDSRRGIDLLTSITDVKLTLTKVAMPRRSTKGPLDIDIDEYARYCTRPLSTLS